MTVSMWFHRFQFHNHHFTVEQVARAAVVSWSARARVCREFGARPVASSSSSLPSVRIVQMLTSRLHECACSTLVPSIITHKISIKKIENFPLACSRVRATLATRGRLWLLVLDLLFHQTLFFSDVESLNIELKMMWIYMSDWWRLPLVRSLHTEEIERALISLVAAGCKLREKSQSFSSFQ